MQSRCPLRVGKSPRYPPVTVGGPRWPEPPRTAMGVGDIDGLSPADRGSRASRGILASRPGLTERPAPPISV